ncbi:serine/threonine-protein kinase [Olsenella urininfantis]|uniref:serine/threonine-protein kinase n=1 Tax=Olsenella urininfantis TaxID=1871033 RepID=UPI001F374FD4|nr:serine/threonine-protein kinase [Olsenella urininfantis]
MIDSMPPSALPTSPSYAQTSHQALLLGRYRIMESCGTGGFGDVLTCWDTRLQRRVAIKRMPLVAQAGHAGMASALDEALKEARTSSMLAHPNIVTVFDFEVDHSYAYLVMEYVDGLTLSELLARVEGGTLTGDECSYLVGSVARALEYAHENGVLHLDIKPTNIMLDRSGRVKLCDFGMATLASATGYGGARGGTVGYMPPEQIVGELVDERSDIFSLAVVTWQALTGENPFAADGAEESLRKIERGPKRSISKLSPCATGMAENVIMQSIQPSQASRLPSVADFSNELCFALGDADEGAASLRALMGQTLDGEAQDGELSMRERLPLAYRYPWLLGALRRASSAVVATWASYPAMSELLQGRPRILLAGLSAVAALTAAWTPLGPVLAMCCLVVALFSGPEGAATIMLPGSLLLLFAWWWARLGRRDRLSSLSTLAGACVMQPFAAPALSSLGLPPLRAAATSAWAWVVATLFPLCSQYEFNANAIVPELPRGLLSPDPLASLAACFLAAFTSSAIARWRPSVGGCIAGQVLCAAILVASRILAVQLGISDSLVGDSWASMTVALLLGMLAGIVTVLRGPLPADEEAEEYDEFA